MLNNQDFAKLIAQPEGKVRFDLKQIETWDKQNDAKLKRKPVSKHSKSENDDGTEEKTKAEKLYRDRAGERRKQTGVSEEESKLEAIAATLDAEQTKFLGGDVEHTHLVKGLDYVLLRRNRDNKVTTDGSHTNDIISQQHDKNKQQYQQSIKASNLVETATKIQINTLFGRNIKMAMDALKGRNQSHNSIVSKTSLNPFVRNAYEFDLNPSSVIDIPTIMLRSKMDIVDSDEKVNYIMPTYLMEKLNLAISNKAKNKLKRKKTDDVYGQQHHITTAVGSTSNNSYGNSNMVKIDPKMKKIAVEQDIDIYGDIFENIGKYEPVGSLSAEEKTGQVSSSTSVGSGSSSNISSNAMIASKSNPKDINTNHQADNYGKTIGTASNSSNSSSSISYNLNNNNNDGGGASSVKGLFKDILKTTSSFDSAINNTNNRSSNTTIDSNKSRTTSTATVSDLLAAINRASNITSVDKKIEKQVESSSSSSSNSSMNVNASSSSNDGLSSSSFLSKMTNGGGNTAANVSKPAQYMKVGKITTFEQEKKNIGVPPAAAATTTAVIHRDIFGTSSSLDVNSNNQKVLQKGDYLSKKGASYEIDEDDDDEGYEKEDAKGSPGGEGKMSSSMSKDKKSSSSSSSLKVNNTATNATKLKPKNKDNEKRNKGLLPNRAARRAMGGGGGGDGGGSSM